MFNKSKVAKTTGNAIKVLCVPVVVYLFFAILSKGKFGSTDSMVAILQQTISATLVSLAIAPNLLCNRFDLSVGASMTMAAIMGTYFANNNGISYPVFALLIVGTAIAMNSITGLVYLGMKVPAMVTTLGMCMIYEMLTNLLNIGWCTALPEDYTLLGNIPICFIIFAAMLALFYFIFTHTEFGYNIRAVANGQQIAKNTGVNTKKNAFLMFFMCGVFVGVASLINVSITGQIAAEQYFSSANILFNCMLGFYVGLALLHYCNLMVGILIGNFIMTMMSAGLLALGLKSSLQNVAAGVVILVIMIVTSNQSRISDYLATKRKAKEIQTKIGASS
jgi:ribose/xylose/arabinose/galactoside ABC-type transport system permease subunit